MKKLSVLVALMLIITVGGVYATWNYAYATANVVPVSESIDVVLTQKDPTNKAKGEIVVDHNDVGILVDDTNGDHIGDLVVTGTSITGRFVPDPLAADDVQDGIPLYYTVSVQNGSTWLLPVITTANLTDDDGELSWTISAQDIRDALHLNLSLPKESDYDTFAESLSNPKVIITIDEGRASTGNEGEGDPGL